MVNNHTMVAHEKVQTEKDTCQEFMNNYGGLTLSMIAGDGV